MTEYERILGLTRERAPQYPVTGLRPAQAECVAEWVRALRTPPATWGPRGIAALLGCGHGKTLVGLLLPMIARTVLGRDLRTLYLVPASLVDQLHSDHANWSTRYDLAPLDVLSHESLSAPSGRWRLRDIAPQLIVIDEAHAFADPNSGRWRRLVEYLTSAPETRVVVMSGSLTWRSVRQARHLLLASLRDACPLPADRSIDQWAAVLDVNGEPCADDHRALAPLRGWAEDDDARAAYRKRLTTAPGVVVTGDTGVAASLRLTAWIPKTPFPLEIAAALDDLEARWVLPDGTELVSSAEKARHGRTLAVGCYLRWVPETVDADWVQRRRAWAREIRNLVTYQGLRYQTARDVEVAAAAGMLPTAASTYAYARWHEVEDAPGPLTEVVWLGKSYLRAVLREFFESCGARSPIVWVETPAIGEAAAAAVCCQYFGAGSRPPSHGGPAICSTRVHATGWDGGPRAGYRDALLLEAPSSAATWEQVLSRLHRPPAVDDVSYHVLATTQGARNAINAGKAGAIYIQTTTGAPQRILSADWVGTTRGVHPHQHRMTT